ncbi:MAG: DUF2442 domain-containing protein [Ignavibacteria bacterium]|nr:DUF2442 domain-containing protein [Ignavibacteria bacterium]
MNTLKGKKDSFDDSYLNMELSDGRIISIPLKWYPELSKATLKQFKNYSFICKNTGIEWEDLDYQLSIESMMAGKVSAKHQAA